MTLGERYTQAQGIAHGSLSREGYEGWRIEKVIMKDKTPSGHLYQLGLIPQKLYRGEAVYPEHEVRRRKALNREMDAIGMTKLEWLTIKGKTGNEADNLEEWIIQKKTRKFMHNIPNDLKRKLLEESIQLLRR